VGDKPLCRAYPILYELCLNQNSSIHDVENEEWMIQFKIISPPIIIEQWYDLAAKLNIVTLDENKDKVVWKWTTSKQFTVKSVYEKLTRDDDGPAYKVIWK
jgi:hypothetical protein